MSCEDFIMDTRQNNERTSAPVLILVGFLAGFGSMMYGHIETRDNYRDNLGPRITATRAQIASIETAIETFKILNGKYPECVEELLYARESGILSHPDALRDAWGTEFQVTFDGDAYEIRSAGPDRLMGTADDITN